MPGNSKNGVWPGSARCAVSLTYDGALPDHLELVRPTLNRMGMHGTFYVTPEGLLERLPEWQAAIQEGHEIGSHSLHGVSAEDGSLPNWNLEMVHGDLEMTQRL